MARGRPATPPGTWGEINTFELGTGKVRAETWLRLHNGKSVRVRCTANSKTAAITNLKARCTQRLGSEDTPTLTSASLFSAVVDEWLKQKADLSPTTKDRYESAINKHIKPAMGDLRLNEITPLFVDSWLQAQSPGIVSNIKSVLKGAFGMATRHGLMYKNPMASIQPTKTTKKEVRALSRDEIQLFRDQIVTSKNQTLIDVVDFCLATGLRAGEVLALRWSDIDLDHKPPLLRLEGTIFYSKETGNKRKNDGKTATATRPIQLPTVAVEIVQRRQLEFGELEMLFPSGAGTYLWENNFNRWLRKWRGENFDWVTIHTLRKTLGSLIADELGPSKAADVLGHADSRLTETVYYERNRVGVPIGEVVDEVLKVSKKCPSNIQNQEN